MTPADAIAHVIDAAKQHRDTLTEYGRLSGAAELLTSAIQIVESGLVADEQRSAA